MMTGPKLQTLTMTLVVTLWLATAVSMSPSPQITTKPAKVLDLRCSIPWHLVLRDQWFSIDGLEIKFCRNGSDKNVTLASISATMEDPNRGEALHSMAKTTGLVQAKNVLDPRPPNLSILTPINSTGVYYCDIEYSKSSTSGMKTLTYKVDMNMIMHKTLVATDVCFSVKLIETDEVKVTWSMIESRSRGADTDIILVERMLKIDDAVAKPRILVSIYQDVVVPSSNFGTILVKLEPPALSNPDGKRQRLLTLFVEHEQCYPDCVYSCEVSGQRCYDELSTGKNETTESTTPEHTTAKNTPVTFDDCKLPWVLFIVSAGIVFVAFVFIIIIWCYKKRRARFILDCCNSAETNTPLNETSPTAECCTRQDPDKNLPEHSLQQAQPHYPVHTLSNTVQNVRVDSTGNLAQAKKDRLSTKLELRNGEGGDTTGEEVPLLNYENDVTGTSRDIQPVATGHRRQYEDQGARPKKFPGVGGVWQILLNKWTMSSTYRSVDGWITVTRMGCLLHSWSPITTGSSK